MDGTAGLVMVIGASCKFLQRASPPDQHQGVRSPEYTNALLQCAAPLESVETCVVLPKHEPTRMRGLRETRYAKSGDIYVAYQVMGDGPIDLVLVHGFVSHLDIGLEEPRVVRFYERLSSFARLIRLTSEGLDFPTVSARCRRSKSEWTMSEPLWMLRVQNGPHSLDFPREDQ